MFFIWVFIIVVLGVSKFLKVVVMSEYCVRFELEISKIEYSVIK